MPATYFPRFSFPNRRTQMPIATLPDKTLHAICQYVISRTSQVEISCSFLHTVNRIKQRKLKKASNYFSVNEGCIRCGYCVMVCPFQNIRLSGKKHEFLDTCNTCFACVHYCSKGVIQFKNRTQGKKRYRHISVSIGDLAGQKR